MALDLHINRHIPRNFASHGARYVLLSSSSFHSIRLTAISYFLMDHFIESYFSMKLYRRHLETNKNTKKSLSLDLFNLFKVPKIPRTKFVGTVLIEDGHPTIYLQIWEIISEQGQRGK